MAIQGNLNGKKVGDHFLSPGWTDYDTSCFYNTYDVTKEIEKGDNALGVMLGNGFYIIPNSGYRKLITAFGNPKMILKLKLIYQHKSSVNIKNTAEKLEHLSAFLVARRRAAARCGYLFALEGRVVIMPQTID